DSDLRTAERMGAGEDGGYDDHFTINGELAGRPAGRWLGGLLGVLTVVVIAAGSWLVWQYFEGELPFWPLQKTPGTVATTAQIEAGSDQDAAGVILSEDDLEAAVSAAVEALSADENEGTTPSVESSTKVEPPLAPAASSAPATALKDVTWEMVDGGTLVVIRGDGLFDRARVRDDGLSAPPRILIRLRDIRVSYRPLEIPVGSPEINLIRLGHHPEKTPPSMWVVFDLTDAGARVQSISTENDLVKILVGTS
ncbi:MAG: hypothetical protein K8R59_08395, partial [Thermoanaerobaculales bacterium]|nr:hypothetical protein [Thermoanaerobaculales bacterium]